MKKGPPRDGIEVPVSVLLSANINLDGVDCSNGVVLFAPATEMADMQTLRRPDKQFWNELVRIRKESPAGPPAKAPPVLSQQAVRKKLLRLQKSAPRQSGDLLDAVITEAYDAAEGEHLLRTALATDVMRRFGRIEFQGGYYLLSTLSPRMPVILAQTVPDKDGKFITDAIPDWASEAWFWADLILELFTGLLTLMGITVRAGRNMGKWVRRLIDIINRNRKLKALILKMARQAKSGNLIGVTDLGELFIALFGEFETGCMLEALGDLVDLGFWGLARLLAKLGSRVIPGVGQALLLADLGLLLVSFTAKLVGHFFPEKKTAD
jgi:hypothetical protein